MEGNNNAPFVYGQKIIRTGPDGNRVKKGVIYTCAGCTKCKCGNWKVFILELPAPNVPVKLSCLCGHVNYNPPLKYYNGRAEHFAPIQHQYTDIAKEIADSFKPTKEVPDKIIVPEKVNN